eukprot:102001_1
MLQSSFKLGFANLFYLILFDATHISQWVMTILMLTDIHVTSSPSNALGYLSFGERGIIGLSGYNLIDALTGFMVLSIFLGRSKMVTGRAKANLKSQREISEALSSMNVVLGTQLLFGIIIFLLSISGFFACEFMKARMGITSALNQSTDSINIYLLCMTCYTKLMPVFLGAYLVVAVTAWASTFTLQISQLLASVSGLCNQAIQRHFIKAVQSERIELIKQMLQHHPALYLSDTAFEDGNNVLHMATKQGNHELMHYWGDQGLPLTSSLIDQQNDKGDTSLHIASRLGDAESVQYLMQRGADISITNNKKCTALDLARRGGYTVIINALSPSAPAGSGPLVVSKEDVYEHKTMSKGIWLIIGGKVYDITAFLKNMMHPAGKAFIKPYYGRDATAAFDAVFHSKDALAMLKTYEIGRLKGFEEAHALERGADDMGSMSTRSLNPPQMPELARNTPIWVKDLYLYPVKGCAGFTVDEAHLTQSGFADDRIYGFVNRATMAVVNQLTYPRLATIKVSFKRGSDSCDEGVVLNDYFVPFVKEKTCHVEWRSSSTPILVWDQGTAPAQWIASFLAEDLDGSEEFMLVRLHEDNVRETEEYFALSFAPRSAQKISAFQNYAAVLLTSQESMDEVNRRYAEQQDKEEEEIGVSRFRPNIVLSGVPRPNYEDFMKHITFGDDEEDDAEILWSRRRYLCAVPQVNQTNGEQSVEPVRTIRRYRNAITLNDRTSLPGDDALFFGSFYTVKHSGRIEVGQSVFCEHSRLGYDDLRTSAGKSFYGLTEDTIGSQFALDVAAQYSEFKLMSKERVNHNVIQCSFGIVEDEEVNHSSNLMMGDHYLLKYSAQEETIIRPYTPVFDRQSDAQSFVLLVKVYAKGRMSSYLNRMQCGDTILCKKNRGKVCYLEPGKMRFGDPRLTMFLSYTLELDKLNLIAAGSGITPIYQIVSNIHHNRKVDTTQCVCFYANVAIKDILLRRKLEEIDRENPNISIHFVVEHADEKDVEQENVHGGRVSNEMCQKYLFPPKSDAVVVTLLCGPPPMENAVKKYILNMGHDKKK